MGNRYMESTSYIAEKSYQIENWLNEGYTVAEIKELLESDQDSENPTFPPNLKLIDAFYDKSSGVSGCAFLDTNTGETIIGFAGTNLDNGRIESLKDFKADAGIFFEGISPDSSYLKEANNFVSGLKNNGYNITQSTGHSLGGAISVLVGLKQNIPTISTYNGAPLYVLSSLKNLKTIVEIRESLNDYEGRIIRFVTEDDFLNDISDFVRGFYAGEKFMFYNGKGHGINAFLERVEQEYISKALKGKNNYWVNNDFSVDFEGDGISDIKLDSQQIRIKNLFSSSGKVHDGTSIKISPSTLDALSNNLSKIISSDMEWIKDAILKCQSKNEEIKNNRELRNNQLHEEIEEGLISSGFQALFSGINDSHGIMLSGDNKSILEDLQNLNTYDITRNFDNWGTSGGRTWYLNGSKFDETDLIMWISDLKCCSQAFLFELTNAGEFEYTQRQGTTVMMKYSTISDVGKSFVNDTDDFIKGSDKSFEGIGLRTGKKDGIPESLADIFEAEIMNVDELSKSIQTLSDLARGLSENFVNIDTYLSDKINKGETIGSIPTDIKAILTYKAYLIENNVLDDVKNINEAFDQQIEAGATKLSKQVMDRYDEPIQRIHVKFKRISEHFSDFNIAVKNLRQHMSSVITSTYYVSELKVGSKFDVAYAQPYNGGNGNGYKSSSYQQVKKTEDHGQLLNYFSQIMQQNIDTADIYIAPIIDEFYSVMNMTEMYRKNLSDFQGYFKTIIERAVYRSMDLESIVSAQVLIRIIIDRIEGEFDGTIHQLLSDNNSNALNKYCEEFREVAVSLKQFSQMLKDCFGENFVS